MVAFVSDRSKPKDQREWQGPWLKKVDHETILKDFEGWDEHYVNLLKVGRIGESKHADGRLILTAWTMLSFFFSRSLQLVPESQRIQWAMHEVLSPETWRKGRITLLGDSVSSHPFSHATNATPILMISTLDLAHTGPRVVAAQRLGRVHGDRGRLRLGRSARSTGM